jgi:hypothetical protein
MRRELGVSRIERDTSRSYKTPPPASSHQRIEAHLTALESLGVITAFMRTCTALPHAQPSEPAQRISDRLVHMADHSASHCPLCALAETRLAESDFLAAAAAYKKSRHARTASSLLMIWVPCRGKDEDETDRRFLFEEYEERLRRRRPYVSG